VRILGRKTADDLLELHFCIQARSTWDHWAAAGELEQPAAGLSFDSPQGLAGSILASGV